MKSYPPEDTLADPMTLGRDREHRRPFARNNGAFGVLSAFTGCVVLLQTLVLGSTLRLGDVLVGFSLLTAVLIGFLLLRALRTVSIWESGSQVMPLWIESFMANTAGLLLNIMPEGPVPPATVLGAYLLVGGLVQSTHAASMNHAKGWHWWFASGGLISLLGIWGFVAATADQLPLLASGVGFYMLANGIWLICFARKDKERTAARNPAKQRHEEATQTAG